MPIKIGETDTTIRDVRIDAIMVINLLASKLRDERGSGLKDRVKSHMLGKGATIATGDIAIAQLRAGSERGPVDVRKFYRLFKDGLFSEKEFLSALSVTKGKLNFLTDKQLERLCEKIDPQPALVVELAVDQVTEALLDYEAAMDALTGVLWPKMANTQPARAA